MKKLYVVVISILAAMLFLPASVIAFLLFTHTGADWLLSALQSRNYLTYSGLTGSIGKGLQLDHLRINRTDNASEGAGVTIETLVATIRLSPLLYGELYVDELSAQRIEVLLPPNLEETSLDQDSEPGIDLLNPGRPILPVTVTLRRLSVDRLIIASADKSHSLHAVELSATVNAQGVEHFKFSTGVTTAFNNTDYSIDLNASGSAYHWPVLKARINADWRAQLPDDSNLTGKLSLQANDTSLKAEHSTTGIINSEIHAQIKHWLKAPLIAVSGRVEQLPVPAQQTKAFTQNTLSHLSVSNIDFSVNGHPDSLTASLSGQINTAGTENGDLTTLPFNLDASLDNRLLDVEELQLNTPGGYARFRGSVDWSEGYPQWQGELGSRDFSPAHFHPLLPEQLNGELTISGQLHQHLFLELTSNNLKGNLRGHSLSTDISATMTNNTVAVKALNASIGSNQLSLSGTVSPLHTDARFALKAPEIEEVFPAFNGTLEASGKIKGSLKAPSITLTASASQLSYADLSTQTLQLGLAVENGVFIGNRNSLEATQLKYGDLSVHKLWLGIQNRWQSPRVSLFVDAFDSQTELTGNLNFGSNRLQGEITQLRIDSQPMTTWQLKAPAQFDYHPPAGNWNLERLCLGELSGSLCIKANNANQHMQITATARQFPLDWTARIPALPLTATGRIDLAAELSALSGVPSGKVSWSLSDQQGLTIAARNATASKAVISQLSSNVLLDSGRAQGELSLRIGESAHINSTFSANDILDTDSPVNAEIRFAIPDLLPIMGFMPAADIQSGSLSGSLTVTNTLREPKPAMTADLTISSIYLIPLDVEWKNLTARIETDTRSTARIVAAGTAGNGELVANGELTMAALDEWLLSLNVSGQNAMISNLPNQRIVASPDLTVQVRPERTQIQGKLAVPDALFRLDSSPERLSLTSAAVIHKENSQQKIRPYELIMDTKVTLGDSVSLYAYGLETRLDGELDLRHREKSGLLAQGQIQLLEGRYRAYGQKLKIDSGSLQFAGPVSQPQITLTASRTTGEIWAGVEISGTADNLQSRLVSNPSMPDSEILSYITRGKPLSETSTVDQHFLSNAALSYAISQSTPVTEKIANYSGLDDLGIGAEEGIESLGLTVGKYISPKLYVRYGYGIVDKLNKLFAQYQLGRHLFLETEVGEGQSVDLIYRSQ